MGILVFEAGCGRLGFDENGPPVAQECAVTISPGQGRVNLNSRRTFAAQGGEPEYEFSVVGDGAGATIDPSTGELLTGPTAGIVTVAVVDAEGCQAEVEVVVGGDTMWFAGGSTAAVPNREVWRSTTGLDWTMVGLLPQRRSNGTLVSFRDRLLYIAGTDAAPVATVYASPDGATWSQIGALPFPASNFGFAIHRGVMVVVGGNGNADNVLTSIDGITWTTVGHLPQNNHGGSLLSYEGQLWYVGGHNGTLFNWVLSSVDGATWTMAGTIPLAREYHSAFVGDGRMWIVGGQDTNPTRLADVSVSVNGTSWSSVAPLPMGRAFGPLVPFAGRVWSLGGSDLGGVWSTDGATWTMHTSTFPQPRQGGASAVFTPHQ